MGLQNAGCRAIQRGIDGKESFKHGNVRGTWFDRGSDIPRGRLDSEIAMPTYGPIYVLFSYATPVAWWADDTGWVQPPRRYSVTTTNHQHIIAVAIAHRAFFDR